MSTIRVIVCKYDNQLWFKKVPSDGKYEIPFPFKEDSIGECTYKRYIIPNCDDEYLEFEFNEDEDISFMECSGPSSECCFLTKKSNIAFFVEASNYMNRCIESVYCKGDKVKIFVDDFDSYKRTNIGYFSETGPTNLMTFSFIEVNEFDYLLPYENL